MAAIVRRSPPICFAVLMRFGLDFGTSNTSLAIWDGSRSTVLPLDPLAGTAMPTVLYVRRDGSNSVGRRAIESYLEDKLLGPLRIPRSRYQGFRPRPRDAGAECARIARWLARHGPIDLCVLGLGRNGHLLMNEPAPSLPPGPHVALLSPSTRRHSMLEGLKTPPRRGLTMGLADILQSRTILLLVSGRQKAAPLRRMLSGRVTTRCPASFLWLHSHVTVHCDRAAGRAFAGRMR